MEKIKYWFEDFFCGDIKILLDEVFFNVVWVYYDIFICSEWVKKMVISGGCFLNDFCEVFKVMIEKWVWSLFEIDGISKEIVLSLWMVKNDVIFCGEDDFKKGLWIVVFVVLELILLKE